MASISSLQNKVSSQARVIRLLTVFGLSVSASLVCVSLLTLSKTNEVLIVPSVVDEMHITASRVPDAYLLALSHDLANTLLGRHPHDTEYFRNNVLRLAHPDYHHAISKQIDFDEENNKFKSGTKVFRPEVLCRVRGQVASEVVGLVEIYINGTRVSNERVAYRYVWKHEGFHVRLQDVRPIDPENSVCLS